MTRLLLAIGLGVAVTVVHAENANERLKEASQVVQEMTNAQDNGIPQDLLEKAKCAIIMPGAKKGGFFLGAQYGRGFAICRNESARGWGAPAAVRMEGGSIGLQIGAAESDVFMLVMNDEGMRKLLDSKFTLDANAGVAAGPVGRSTSAKTDAHLTAGILAWSRSRGAFAGLTVGGGTLRNDLDENKEIYGKPLMNKEILQGNIKPPESALALVSSLNRLSREEGQRARPADAK
jgi:lipid-binding SYLF domain-containing protein